MNPPVSGKPAKPSMKSQSETPSSGRSQPKPARFVERHRRGRSSRSRAATTANAPSDIAPYGIR